MKYQIILPYIHINLILLFCLLSFSTVYGQKSDNILFHATIDTALSNNTIEIKVSNVNNRKYISVNDSTIRFNAFYSHRLNIDSIAFNNYSFKLEDNKIIIYISNQRYDYSFDPYVKSLVFKTPDSTIILDSLITLIDYNSSILVRFKEFPKSTINFDKSNFWSNAISFLINNTNITLDGKRDNLYLWITLFYDYPIDTAIDKTYPIITMTSFNLLSLKISNNKLKYCYWMDNKGFYRYRNNKVIFKRAKYREINYNVDVIL